MLIMTVLFIILTILVYLVICLAVGKDIEKNIKKYREDALKEGVIDYGLIKELNNNKKTIIMLGAIGWPLYYLFCMGASFGSDIYNLLTRDNYENRIATWFIRPNSYCTY